MGLVVLVNNCEVGLLLLLPSNLFSTRMIVKGSVILKTWVAGEGTHNFHGTTFCS